MNKSKFTYRLSDYRRFAVTACVITQMVAGCDAMSPSAALPADCDGLTDLFAVSELMARTDHPCYEWVAATHGRVARSSNGSAVVASDDTPFGAAVIVSALHVLGAGWFGSTGVDLPANIVDAADQTGVGRIELIDAAGFVAADTIAPMFDYYNPMIPAEENLAGLFDILPRNDFVFSIVDGQMLERGLVAPAPGPLTATSPALFDPQMLADDDPPIGGVCPAELVLIIGYPAGFFNGEIAAGVGRVLDDDEAVEVIEELAAAGDVEGDIPYEPQVEMIIEGEAQPGMSGGGIFDRDGVLVGVLVRASDPIDDTRYIRAVRLTFAARQVAESIEALPDGERTRIERFWDASMSDAAEPMCITP